MTATATIDVKAKPVFDYGHISHDEKAWLENAAIEIEQRHAAIEDNVKAIGRRLTEAKARLPHGQFTSWVESKFPFKIRMAQGYMRVYEVFGENPQLTAHMKGFGIEALKLIASSVSSLEPEQQEAKVQAIAAANEAKIEFHGQQLTVAEVRQLLRTQQHDIGQLKTQNEMAAATVKIERANTQRAVARLEAQIESENERIEAAKNAAYQETLQDFEQEMSALEAKNLETERRLKELKGNPSPEMQAEIARLEQNKQLIQRDIRDLVEERGQLARSVKSEGDRQEIIKLAQLFNDHAGQMLANFSLLGLEPLPDEAIADAVEGLKRVELLAAHIKENLGEGQYPPQEDEE